jgi:RNA polymerase sigma factor (sigma-70 family)
MSDGKDQRDGKNRLFDFFAREGRKLRSYAKSRLRSFGEMDAEDIVEEVMLSVIQKADITSVAENLAAYVYRSIRNRVIDHIRKNSRTESLAAEDEGGQVLDMLVSSASVGGEAERHETLQRIGQAIGRLEPRQRAVFVATEIRGMSFRELSAKWNEPVGTLLSRKSRAVKALREMLWDLKDDE